MVSGMSSYDNASNLILLICISVIVYSNRPIVGNLYEVLHCLQVIDLVRQCSPSDGSGRNYGIGSGFLASYLYH